MRYTSIISILIVLMILCREMRARPSRVDSLRSARFLRAGAAVYFLAGVILLLLPILFRHLSAQNSEWFPEMGVTLIIVGLASLFYAGRKERTAK